MQTNGGAGRGLAAMGAVLAALAIGLSAYAAHGVADAQARGNLQTASLYAFAHGAVLLLLAQAPARRLRWLALAGLLLALLATRWLARLFARRIGGYTGDCLGATQQLAEIAFYCGLLCRFS